MKTGWNIDKYCNYIKLQLGGSVVSLAIEKDLPFIVEMAFEELKNYINTVHSITCNYTPTINLDGLNVASVRSVLRGQINNSTITGMDTNLFIYQTQGQYGINQWAMDQITYNLLLNQVKNTLSTDMDFKHDKVNEKLYLSVQNPIPISVTINYLKDYQDVNEIVAPHWITYLKRLSLAMAKETEGRIRSKYTPTAATYQLDGDKLMSEAQAELTQIRSELNSNVHRVHTIS